MNNNNNKFSAYCDRFQSEILQGCVTYWQPKETYSNEAYRCRSNEKAKEWMNIFCKFFFFFSRQNFILCMFMHIMIRLSYLIS